MGLRPKVCDIVYVCCVVIRSDDFGIALLQYQDRVVEYAEQLERHIAVAASTGEPVNVSSWFYWFSFDVMGEFAFARSFEMLQNEKWHEAVLLLRRAMTLLGPLSPVPWLAQIGFSLIPGLWVVRDWYTMMAWCKERMRERIAVINVPFFVAVDPRGLFAGLIRMVFALDESRSTRCFVLVDRSVRRERQPRKRPELAQR